MKRDANMLLKRIARTPGRRRRYGSLVLTGRGRVADRTSITSWVRRTNLVRRGHWVMTHTRSWDRKLALTFFSAFRRAPWSSGLPSSTILRRSLRIFRTGRSTFYSTRTSAAQSAREKSFIAPSDGGSINSTFFTDDLAFHGVTVELLYGTSSPSSSGGSQRLCRIGPLLTLK